MKYNTYERYYQVVIAGYGFVGKAVEAGLKDYCKVNWVDTAYSSDTVYDYNPTCVIIAVSTPPREDGACDMTNVIDVVSQCEVDTPILIKSTISVEGWRALKQQFPKHSITFSPEFLRANSAIEDFLNQEHIYLGGDNTEYWQQLFNNAMDKPCVILNAEELILAKQLRNSFLATKVTFFNQANDLCKQLDLDYEQVRQAVTDDERIGESHSEISKQGGFGGHCFPKDTEALVYSALHHGCSQTLVQEAIRYNKKKTKPGNE